MLNLYCGRACIDNEKFMYEIIGKENPNRKVIILVPDQFTLQAERTAFEKLQTKSLINVEIMSFTRLGHHILSEAGGTTRVFIDELGKHMILSKILNEQKSSLTVYRNAAGKKAFIEMMVSLISEMKQFNVAPKQIQEMLEKNKDKANLLHQKLEDVAIIYDGYEKAIEGKYIDTEDYIKLFTEKAAEADFLKGVVLWIDGFDYYTNKTYDLLTKLMTVVDQMNINFTMDQNKARDYDLFSLPEKTIWRFQKIAEENGIICEKYEIPEKYRTNKCDEINHLEAEIYAYPYKKFPKQVENVSICVCGGYYAEAETVAAKIVELVREKGYRYRDIAVVCNDIEVRGIAIDRLFNKYGIAHFMDRKRKVLHNPFIAFILAVPTVVQGGYRHEDVFRLLRTGFCDFSYDECERLESYALKYGIRGTKWKKEFTKCQDSDPDGYLSEMNALRDRLLNFMQEYESKTKKCKTAADITLNYFDFLTDTVKLPEKILESVDKLKIEEQYELASETAQIWNMIISIFDQLVEMSGEFEISKDLYLEMLTVGLATIEIGVIPTTIDQVIVGNMQRTRTGNIRAMFVVGANDGVLPAVQGQEGIFHEREKNQIANLGIELSKNDEMRMSEERLAIYRMFARASEYLHISYSVKDSDGGELKPSLLIDRIKKVLGEIKEEKDIFNREDPMALINTPLSTLNHLSDGFCKKDIRHQKTDYWKAATNWLLSYENYRERLRIISQGMFFANDVELVSEKVYSDLFREPLVMSSTRLEAISRCPFSHFIKYGIRPDEGRVYEVAAPEIGNIYHEALKNYTDNITSNQKWETITVEECENEIDNILEALSKDYMRGILIDDAAGKYRFSRLKKVCSKTAWMVTEHVQKGKFTEFYFETAFGRDQFLPPIKIETSTGKIVYIEGRIDRIDILKDGNDEYVKIIDYKSGNDKVVMEEILSGYKLQLMLYMNAAMEGLAAKKPDKNIRPAGAFYFKIGEPSADITYKSIEDTTIIKEFLEAEFRKTFRMDGIVVNDLTVIEGIDADFQGYSDIIKVRKGKEGDIKGNGTYSALEANEFQTLQEGLRKTVNELVNSFAEGNVRIEPKKLEGGIKACTYCLYNAVCMFDTSCEGFAYKISRQGLQDNS